MPNIRKPDTERLKQIRYNDLAAQRALVNEIRAEPFTGSRCILPRIKGPRRNPTQPLPQLFEFLPEMRRPLRPWELPPAEKRAARRVPVQPKLLQQMIDAQQVQSPQQANSLDKHGSNERKEGDLTPWPSLILKLVSVDKDTDNEEEPAQRRADHRYFEEPAGEATGG